MLQKKWETNLDLSESLKNPKNNSPAASSSPFEYIEESYSFGYSIRNVKRWRLVYYWTTFRPITIFIFNFSEQLNISMVKTINDICAFLVFLIEMSLTFFNKPSNRSSKFKRFIVGLLAFFPAWRQPFCRRLSFAMVTWSRKFYCVWFFLPSQDKIRRHNKLGKVLDTNF